MTIRRATKSYLEYHFCLGHAFNNNFGVTEKREFQIRHRNRNICCTLSECGFRLVREALLTWLELSCLRLNQVMANLVRLSSENVYPVATVTKQSNS